MSWSYFDVSVKTMVCVEMQKAEASFIFCVRMFFQGSGAGPARGSGKTASDAAHATLVHPGTEERAG